MDNITAQNRLAVVTKLIGLIEFRNLISKAVEGNNWMMQQIAKELECKPTAYDCGNAFYDLCVQGEFPEKEGNE